MRYVCMHKASPRDEAGQLPPAELIEGMGRLIGETAKAGRLLAGDGLHRSALRLRLTFAGGECQVTPGPYRGDDDVPERMVIIKVHTRDEAIDWARRYGLAVGAQRLELGPVTEAWDLGMMPKPEGAPLRFMILHQSSAAREAGTPPSAAERQAVKQMLAEMQQAGVLLFAEDLLPSSKGMRVRYRDNHRTRLDGPFAESKELIGGFCMVQMDSLDEIAVWLDQFARILGGNVEVDVRVAADQGGAR